MMLLSATPGEPGEGVITIEVPPLGTPLGDARKGEFGSQGTLGHMAVSILSGVYKDVRPLVDETFPAIVGGLALLDHKRLAIAEQLAGLGKATQILVVAFAACNPAERLALLRLAGLGPRDRAAAIAFLMAQAAS